MKKTSKHTVKNILTYVFIALLIGLLTGWIRYWTGYYVLLQGILAGLLISWTIHQLPGGREKILSDASFKLTALLFLSFMVGQAIGFGWAQPWFDPAGWVTRILNGKTSESVFGIFSTGGVVHEFYSNGVNDGFWIVLSLLDLAFMFFLLLVSLPPKTAKKKS